MSEPTSPAELLLRQYLIQFHGRTREAYGTDLRMFYRWCESNELDPLTVRRYHLDMFVEYLREVRGNGQATVYRRVTALRRLYQYAAEEDFIDKSPARAVRAQRPNWEDLPPIALTPDEFQALLHAANDPTDRALIATMGYLGLRVSEACSLNVDDFGEVHDGHRTLQFVGKGGKPARMPVTDALGELLSQAIGGRESGPLFARRDGTRLPRRTAQRVVTRVAKKAGLNKQVTPHSLRHTFVVSAIDAGVHLRTVQLAARHRDISTTLVYDRQRQVPMAKHAAHDVARFLDSAS